MLCFLIVYKRINSAIQARAVNLVVDLIEFK